jgi:hypothetical protein
MSNLSDREFIERAIAKLQDERRSMGPLESPPLSWYRELWAWERALVKANG